MCLPTETRRPGGAQLTTQLTNNIPAHLPGGNLHTNLRAVGTLQASYSGLGAVKSLADAL